MGRKDFSSMLVQNYITQPGEDENKLPETVSVPLAVDEKAVERPAVQPRKTAEKTEVEAKRGRKPTATEPVTQKGFYITAVQEKKIKMAALEKGTDASAIVRAAIDSFFEKG